MQEKLWLQLVLRNKSVQISDHQKTDVKFFTSVFFFLLFTFCCLLSVIFFLPFSSCQFPAVSFSLSISRCHDIPHRIIGHPEHFPQKIRWEIQKICGCTIGVSRKSTRFCQHPCAVLVKFAGDNDRFLSHPARFKNLSGKRHIFRRRDRPILQDQTVLFDPFLSQIRVHTGSLRNFFVCSLSAGKHAGRVRVCGKIGICRIQPLL